MLWGAVLYGPVPDAGAQTVEARVGRFFDSGGWTTYRIGLRRPLIGILGVQVHGDLLRAVCAGGGMAGVGTDLTAFRKGVEGPYLVAGLSGGLGSQTSNDLSNGWGSWSAGVGYDVFPASFFSVGVEGRWRELSLVFCLCYKHEEYILDLILFCIFYFRVCLYFSFSSMKFY